MSGRPCARGCKKARRIEAQPRGALREKKSEGPTESDALDIHFTLCQVLRRDVVERVNFLHDQLLLVDLDHERSIPFAPSKPELADRVLEFLWDVYGMGLVGCVRKKTSTTAEK
jgi:hypothetical protein